MRLRLTPLTLGRIVGIPIRISHNWFLIFVLHITLVSIFYLPFHLADLPQWSYWGQGVLMTLLLFLSVLGHELGHALVARIEGLRILDITLHLFGGLARFDREAPTPKADFKIAVAGPSSSFLIASLFFILNQISIYLVPSRSAALMTNYLGLTNLILAVFNLLPGYPLDGGRMLRAWLWHRQGSFAAATRWAVRAGRGIAYFLIGCGLMWIIAWRTSADLFIGGWFILIGIFVKDAADGSVGYLRSIYGLDHLTVTDVMSEPVAISLDTTVEQLLCQVLPRHRQTSFPVSHLRRFCGIVLLDHLKSIPRYQWSQLTARDVMRPVNPMMFVHPHTSLTDAHSLLLTNEVGSAGVIDDDGYLVGYIGLLEIQKLMTRRHRP